MFFRQLHVCYYGVPSPTTGLVCNLQLLLGLASAVPVGSAFRCTHDQISLSQLWVSSNLEGQVPIWKKTVSFYSPTKSKFLVGLATRYYFHSVCCCLKFAVLFLRGALSDCCLATANILLLA
jgi:hypothetical protein